MQWAYLHNIVRQNTGRAWQTALPFVNIYIFTHIQTMTILLLISWWYKLVLCSININIWVSLTLFVIDLGVVLVFFTQLGHLHSIPCSSICCPIALVMLTHLPWNQSSQLSQHIMKRLLWGCLQIHHSLKANKFDYNIFRG